MRFVGIAEALCTIPATFQKIHTNRKHPVHIVYRRPHIQRSHKGEARRYLAVRSPLRSHCMTGM
jgi:hypothetical protein